MEKTFLRILDELGWPPIYLVHPRQFKAMDGDELNYMQVGLASTRYPIISVHPLLVGKAMENTIYHEIAHHLWPWQTHWWIDLFGEKMAGGGGMGWWSSSYNKTLNDIPPRKRLVQMARRQAEKLKVRYQTGSLIRYFL